MIQENGLTLGDLDRNPEVNIVLIWPVNESNTVQSIFIIRTWHGHHISTGVAWNLFCNSGGDNSIYKITEKIAMHTYNH